MQIVEATPPLWRLIVAFAVAPAVAALAFACGAPLYEGLPSLPERIWRTFQVDVVIGGYLPAIIIGLPMLFLLKGRVQPTLFNCALAGSFVAALPWIILCLFSRGGSASVGSKATMINGMPTFFGLLEAAKLISEIAALGLLGGLVFGAIVTAGKSSTQVSD